MRAAQVGQLLDTALARRAGLLADPQTTVGRLFDAAADGIDGLVIEKLGDVLVAQLHEGRLGLSETAARDVCAEVARRVAARAVYRKVFPKDRAGARGELDRLHTDPTPWIGTPVEEEIAVLEGGMTFLVRPYDGYATGLYLDHRLERQRVRELASGLRVLNTFAYTCGFGVAAALGGAAGTVNVDISRKHLEWGKRNVTVNRLSHDAQRFICSDVFDYYRRARRQGQRFDFVILDPPTFARQKRPRRDFVLAEDLDRLVAGAISLLENGGYVHVSVNHQGTSARLLEQAIGSAASAAGLRWEWPEPPASPEDFGGGRTQHARSVLVRLCPACDRGDDPA